MFVTKYVGDLAFFAVVRAWDGLWGATWDAEGVPEKSVLVRDGTGGAGKVCAKKCRGAWGAVGEDVVYP